MIEKLIADGVKNKLDETIMQICEKVEEYDFASGAYAETIKALAELVKARASLD